MLRIALLVACVLVVAMSRSAFAEPAKVIEYHGYSKAIELKSGNARAVLCPEVGGRPIEFSIDGKNSLYLDDKEGTPVAGRPIEVSAGRFDFGPEMIVPRHPKIWSGAWTAEITGERSAKLTSQKDESSGVQLTREFELKAGEGTVGRPAPTKAAAEGARSGDRPQQSAGTAGQASGGTPAHLSCKQTITNVSEQTVEYCHWGRSFAIGGGIALIPLDGKSRFPSKYALYEEGGTINVKATDANIRERDGFLEVLAAPRKPKLGFDSYAGWLAYVMPGDMLFVKRFATFPDRVYNEAAGLTISVWYPVGNRVELEPIGPRERLAPGQSASFTEEWYLTSYPFPKSGENVDLTKLKAAVAEMK